MRAVSLDRFGGPEVLQFGEVPAPRPISTEVLVRVHAAGINPVDLRQRQGHGPLSRLPMILGWDVAGVVQECGFGVTIFSPGDEVYGMPWFPRQAGAYAEYVTAPSRHFAPKPPSLSFPEAATLPLSGLTAWQLLVDTAHLKAGDRVLIHGAAGGVGRLAVQIATSLGAHVIGVARADHHDELRALGAAELVDYTTTRFEDVVGPVNVVLDLVGRDYTPRSLPLVTPGGTVVLVPSGVDDAVARLGADKGVRVTNFLVEPDHAGLLALSRLVAEGRLESKVGATVPLEDASRAHQLAESRTVGGKVVLSV
ncbi:NADP-dependent oxidoreductase [Dactylosporangium sp. CA-139066]|uniref:NADP-dependent oxidoreductase n=1 Tax=Dactylosporangium sp. CA-139066 TaxID=3239930 RepID=UPI003D8AF506